MKTLFLIAILIAQTLLVFSQDTTDSLSETSDENSGWLAILRIADKDQQLTIIQNRFFGQSIETYNADLPILIIDGVPVSPDDRTREFFLNNLTADKVDIKVLDKEPEGLYINKRFTGVIVIRITDKRMSKKFKRLG